MIMPENFPFRKFKCFFPLVFSSFNRKLSLLKVARRGKIETAFEHWMHIET